ncbi:MAG: ribonuclease P protein component [Bacilli bacterium]|nr:ribonuclease P protein component [Bacilli bacterium]
MKKYEIVKEHKDFDNIINTGKYKRGSHYIIYNKDNESNISRFGIAVSKKFGHAVDRNRIKRVTRMILETNKNMFKKDFDYIIIVKRSAIDIEYKALEKDILDIIKGD